MIILMLVGENTYHVKKSHSFGCPTNVLAKE
jgi:hypothetical protein